MDDARQRIPRAGDEGVRLGEASQGGVPSAGGLRPPLRTGSPSRIIVHQPEGVGHAALTGVLAPFTAFQECCAIVGGSGSPSIPGFTPGHIHSAARRDMLRYNTSQGLVFSPAGHDVSASVFPAEGGQELALQLLFFKGENTTMAADARSSFGQLFRLHWLFLQAS